MTLLKDGNEELRGKAYIVRDGSIKQIRANGETVLL